MINDCDNCECQRANEVFLCMCKQLQDELHSTSVEKGFYDKPVDDASRIALMHSELSEALEAMRHGNPPDDKIPEYSGVEAELADTIIRILDFSSYKGFNVMGALIAKKEMNKTRAKMHGGKKF